VKVVVWAIWGAALSVAVGATHPEPANAAKGNQNFKKLRAKPKAEALAKLKAELESGEPKRIESALAVVREAPADWIEGTPIIERWLADGATIELATIGVVTLEALARPSSSAVIAPFVRIRSPQLRLAAVVALGATGGPDAAEPLIAALRGSDEELRRAAATSLGKARIASAVPELLEALDKGVLEAAPSVGLLCDATSCAQLLERLGKAPFEAMSAGIVALFGRRAGAPEAATLAAVERVRDLQTEPAIALLRRLRDAWKKGDGDKLKRALDQALASLGQGKEKP
jgi:HEAT repeat protein